MSRWWIALPVVAACAREPERTAQIELEVDGVPPRFVAVRDEAGLRQILLDDDALTDVAIAPGPYQVVCACAEPGYEVRAILAGPADPERWPIACGTWSTDLAEVSFEVSTAVRIELGSVSTDAVDPVRVRPGVYDIVVEELETDRVAILRDVSIAGSMTIPIDLTSAVPLPARPVEVAGLADDGHTLYASWRTANGTLVSMGPPNSTSVEVVPSELWSADDEVRVGAGTRHEIDWDLPDVVIGGRSASVVLTDPETSPIRITLPAERIDAEARLEDRLVVTWQVDGEWETRHLQADADIWPYWEVDIHPGWVDEVGDGWVQLPDVSTLPQWDPAYDLLDRALWYLTLTRDRDELTRESVTADGSIGFAPTLPPG